MKYIDLHLHTTASDGTATPYETVREAAERGLAAIAVTDHDTAAGAAEAVTYASQYGIEVIPGIEISADYLGYGIHILGYFIDPAAASLRRLLDGIIAERERRNRLIAAAIAADGVPITYESLAARCAGTVIGRPHFAAVLVEHGRAATVQEAFDRYLDEGRPYYRPRQYISLDEAFTVIHEAGGIASFAHPLQYGFSPDELDKLTARMASLGCRGMECLYSGYTPEQSAALMSLAARYGLVTTGGSDSHGKRKPHIQMGIGTGTLRVPESVLTELKAVCAACSAK